MSRNAIQGVIELFPTSPEYKEHQSFSHGDTEGIKGRDDDLEKSMIYGI